MKEHLKKRLTYLWTWELANGLLIFPAIIYILSMTYRLGWFSVVSLGVVCAILVIGAAFWFLKKRALDDPALLAQPSIRSFFRTCKILFGAMMPLLLVLFVVRASGQQPVPLADLVVGAILAVFAGLEYINYYFIQLSYDNRADLQYLFSHRRLKRATMVRELDI